MHKLLMAVWICGITVAQTKSAAPKAPAKAAPKTPAVKPNLLDPSTLKAQAPAVYKVKLTTTKGDVIIQVTRAWAPNGADRFYNLVRAGYYTNMPIFRVIAGFMAQFGVSGRPEVSRVWAQASIPDDPVTQSNKRGMVTYAAASAPNTRSTQIFINYGDNSRLDKDRFAPFGQVVEGMENVDKLYSDYGDTPDQMRLGAQGNAYVDRSFPKLDKIVTATIVPATPAAPKPAAPKTDDKK